MSGLDVRTIRDIERGRTSRPRRSSADLLAHALSRDELSWDAVRAQLRGAIGPSGDPAVAADPDGAVPRQLPGGVRHFTGRADELARLTELADQAGQERPGAVVISAIGGTAGVGKTALAVRWAHQAASRFPDGQLYVDLRGYGPGRPVRAADALAAFLRALGVPDKEIPQGLDERATRYRSQVAGRRILVLLDNAGSDEQARPLLPGSSTCMTLVTSRSTLAGLVARDGAARMNLDLLPETDSIELLTALIGPRAAADPVATAMLALRCSRLPLALRVAAELAATRPADPLSGLVAELGDRRDRLELLDAIGDPATAVRTVFSWSCQHLEPGTALVFRLAGLHPGPDLDAYAAAALTGERNAAEAGRQLGQLARVHLMDPAVAGRYSMHDLLRGYAAELAASDDGEAGCQAALARLFDYYLHTTTVAMRALYTSERLRRPEFPAPATPVPSVTSQDAAQAWLDSHLDVLVAVIICAADGGWPDYAIRLSAAVAHHLFTTSRYTEAIAVHSCVRRAAHRCGDQVAEGAAVGRLGDVALRRGRYPQAARYFRQSLALFRAAGDRAGEARALGNFGWLEAQQGRFEQAARHQRQVLALFRALDYPIGQSTAQARLGEVELRLGRYAEAKTNFTESLAFLREAGDPSDQAYLLGNLCELELRQGRYDQARTYIEQALELSRLAGDRVNEAFALGNLGDIELLQGRPAQARARIEEALAIFRATGELVNESYGLASLGEIDLRQAQYPQAIVRFRQALALLRQTADRADESRALNGLGQALLGDGQPGPARTAYVDALALADQTGDTAQQARACDGLGRLCLQAADPGQASRHWERALALYTQLGAPEADQVRASLRNLTTA